MLAEAERLQIESMLSGEADLSNDTFVEVRCRRRRHQIPGLGGDAAQDVRALGATSMAARSSIWRSTPARRQGIKRATIMVKAPNAYGWLKTESGVHRLVRISPFDSNARRRRPCAERRRLSGDRRYDQIDTQTPADVRTDTYRSSGSGGQHVNTTDSAVRLTYIPTGIAVACQERALAVHKNRDTAWKMLKARLYELRDREARSSSTGAQRHQDRDRAGATRSAPTSSSRTSW